MLSSSSLHKLNVTSGYWSTKVWFCSGSRTSSRAAAGSPCKLRLYTTQQTGNRQYVKPIITISLRLIHITSAHLCVSCIKIYAASVTQVKREAGWSPQKPMRFFILTVNYKSILVQIISNDSIVSIRYLYTSTKDVVFPLVCLFVCLLVC